jgi:FkbH-like protein
VTTPNTARRAPEHPVKLVIWDLDDTYWSGTLSEGPVTEIAETRAMVSTLNRRGIVNAICSKNDRSAVRARLEADGMWDEFVFPSINWEPKGPRIAALIDDMGLRPVNVVFVDDNVNNLREAEHYAEGIQTLLPEDLADFLDDPNVRGKDDSALSRLAQYRMLETRVEDRNAMAGSNEEFLRSSQIAVGLHDDVDAHFDRVLELINRSNQLNYTKQRFEPAEFRALLDDPAVTSGYVTVRDRYGDHGICGFYAHDDRRTVNLSFSCRILNMGVEQWVYQRIGALPIDVVGEVSTPLAPHEPVDWIAVDDGSERAVPETPAASGAHGRVLLKGGCDLSVVAEHLGGAIETEFTFPSRTGALVHQEHTEILRRATPEQLERYGDVIDRLPFLDRSAYESAILTRPESFDVIVYSVLMDYTQGIYRYRDTDFVVPFGELSVDVTQPDAGADYVRRLGRVGFDEEFRAWFAENFHFEGGLTPEAIGANVRWLREVIPASVRLVIMNGAEVPSPSSIESTRHEHHAACNAVLERTVATLPNTEISDVRPVIASSDDLTDNIRHYSRRAYFELANHLSTTLSASGVRAESRAAHAVRSAVKTVRKRAYRLAGRALKTLRGLRPSRTTTR